MQLKVGDLVKVIAVPEFTVSDGPETRTVFERSVGRTFPIIDITAAGFVELEVGEVVGAQPHIHSIWLKPEFLELVDVGDKAPSSA